MDDFIRSCSVSANEWYARNTGIGANPGRSIHQYETSTWYCCACASIFPQLGNGSPMPSPRKQPGEQERNSTRKPVKKETRPAIKQAGKLVPSKSVRSQ